jgi:hypothetical protein
MARRRLLSTHPHAKLLQELEAFCEKNELEIVAGYQGDLLFNFRGDEHTYTYREIEGEPSQTLPSQFKANLTFDSDH